MKILTLYEPWATLMAMGLKRIETRGFQVRYRGHLAIHASKGGLGKAALETQCFDSQFYRALREFPPFSDEISRSARRKGWIADIFPHGCVVGVVWLENCLPTVSDVLRPGVFEGYPDLDTPQERAFGNYEEGRYGWVTKDARMLSEPLPFRGSQGIRDLPVNFEVEMWKRITAPK